MIIIELKLIDDLPAYFSGMCGCGDCVGLIDKSDADRVLPDKFQSHFLKQCIENALTPMVNVDANRTILKGVKCSYFLIVKRE